MTKISKPRKQEYDVMEENGNNWKQVIGVFLVIKVVNFKELKDLVIGWGEEGK